MTLTGCIERYQQNPLIINMQWYHHHKFCILSVVLNKLSFTKSNNSLLCQVTQKKLIHYIISTNIVIVQHSLQLILHLL